MIEVRTVVRTFNWGRKFQIVNEKQKLTGFWRMCVFFLLKWEIEEFQDENTWGTPDVYLDLKSFTQTYWTSQIGPIQQYVTQFISSKLSYQY